MAVDGAGGSGHIGRGLANGLGGQIGAGTISAAGVLNHIGAGSLLVDGLGGSGNINDNLDGLSGQLGTGVIAAAGILPGIGEYSNYFSILLLTRRLQGGGALAIGGIGGSGHISRNLADGLGGQIGTGVINAAGVLNHVGGGGVVVDGLGASGHVGR